MKATVTDAAALPVVTIADLAAYLRASGWTGQKRVEEGPRDNVSAWSFSAKWVGSGCAGTRRRRR